MRNGTNGSASVSSRGAPERTLVLHPCLRSNGSSRREPEARLEEAIGLARAIDLRVVGGEICRLGKPRPATYLGRGAVEALGERIAGDRIAIVIVDAALSPGQQRNLERAWNCKVLDRTGLILEIFGERARTKEGALQVELAHLSYQRSRLVRSWTHLERQRGGFGFLGGPGETQIEADRRQIGARIKKIEKELETVRRTRELHRRARRRVPYPIVALVGYTNAGKSTLFNRVTRAQVAAENQLFATLDPTMRAVGLPSGRNVIFSDTVGFVSELPTGLVAAFRATLEEVIEADAIVHVRDIAHPDSEAQRADVLDVLASLGIDPDSGAPVVEALNKTDLLADGKLDAVLNRAGRAPDEVAISALTGQGMDALFDLLDRKLGGGRRVVDLSVSLADGAGIAWLYRYGEVFGRVDRDGAAHIKVGLESTDLDRFMRRAAVTGGHAPSHAS